MRAQSQSQDNGLAVMDTTLEAVFASIWLTTWEDRGRSLTRSCTAGSWMTLTGPGA